jgi:hypothetical protein
LEAQKFCRCALATDLAMRVGLALLRGLRVAFEILDLDLG